VEVKLFRTAEIRDADAAFFCGTAAEVIGWDSLDGVQLKKEWNDSLGKQIQDAYKERVTENEVNYELAGTAR